MSMLSIEKKREGNKLTAAPVGRIDVMTAPRFESEILSDLEGVTELVLDLKGLEYISSAGLRVVASLHKTMKAGKGKLTVCSPSESIIDIFTATGLMDYLDIKK